MRNLDQSHVHIWEWGWAGAEGAEGQRWKDVHGHSLIKFHCSKILASKLYYHMSNDLTSPTREIPAKYRTCLHTRMFLGHARIQNLKNPLLFYAYFPTWVYFFPLRAKNYQHYIAGSCFCSDLLYIGFFFSSKDIILRSESHIFLAFTLALGGSISHFLNQATWWIFLAHHNFQSKEYVIYWNLNDCPHLLRMLCTISRKIGIAIRNQWCRNVILRSHHIH